MLTLALSVAVAIRLVFYHGISSPDEINYVRHAGEWWKDRFDMRDVLYLHGTRLLVFVPVAWAFAAGGARDAMAVAWPFLASIGTVVVVYAVGRRLFGREIAAYSAFSSALLPLMIRDAVSLYPGAVMNLVIGLSVLSFVVSQQAEKKRSLWLMVSGLLFGAMQMAGELGLVLGSFVVAAIVAWRRGSVWSYWPFVGGFAVMIGLSASYYWIETGDALFKTHISRTILSAEQAPFAPFLYARVMLHPFYANGGILYLAALGGILAALHRRREALFLLLWLLLTWVLVEFGSSSLTTYRPLYKNLRYLSVVSVPAVLLAGYAGAWIRAAAARVSGRRRISFAAAGAVFLVALGVSLAIPRDPFERAEDVQQGLERVREIVRQHKGETVLVTHWFWNAYVGYSMGFDEDYFPSGYDPYRSVRLETVDAESSNRYVQTLRPGERIGPALLVHDERFLEASRGERTTGLVRRGEIPDVLGKVPPEWSLTYRVTLGQMYLPAMYNIPEGAVWPGP